MLWLLAWRPEGSHGATRASLLGGIRFRCRFRDSPRLRARLRELIRLECFLKCDMKVTSANPQGAGAAQMWPGHLGTLLT